MKKWTYLVATLLMMGTTPLLIGCIDNDEPAGIEELRGAKAELLSAKAVVEAAKVATEQANAAYMNAQAEYVKACAAYQSALAAKEQAEADRTNLEAQAAAAEAAQKLEAAKAEAEQAAKDWELAYQSAQARYQSLLITLATRNSTAIDKALTNYKADVTSAKSALDSRADEVVAAQRAFNKATTDLEEDEAKRELNTRDLQKKVLLAERAKEGSDEALEQAKKEYEEAQGLQVSDLKVKLDEYQAQLDGLNKEIADLSVAAAEKKYQYDLTYLPEIKTLTAASEDLYGREIELPAFSLTLGGNLPEGVTGTLKSDASAYTLSNLENYNNRLQTLEELLKHLESWTRDANGNDDKWTDERIGRLEVQKKAAAEDYEKVETIWKNAVAAFNTNQPDVTDPTKVTAEYNALKADVDAYNTAATAYNAEVKKISDANKAKENAEKAYTKAVSAAEDTYETEKAKLDASYNETIVKLPETAKAQVATYAKALETAKKDLDAAKAAYDKEATDATLAAYTSATIVYNTAVKNAAKTENEIQQELETSATEAYTASAKTLETEKTTAIADAEKAKKAADDAQDAIITASKKALPALTKTLQAAAKKITDTKTGSYMTFYKAVYNNGQGSDKSGIVTAAVAPAVDSKEVKTVKIAELAALSKDELREAIKSYSRLLFGDAVLYNSAIEDSYNDPTIRLVEVTDEQIASYVAKEMEKKESEYSSENGCVGGTFIRLADYIELYDRFGYKGAVVACDEQIKLAKAVKENDSDVLKMIETTTQAITALEAAHEAAEKEVEAAEEALSAKRIEYNEKLAETILPIEEARAGNEPLQNLVNAYIHAIEDYKQAAGDNSAEAAIYDEADLKAYVAACKKSVEKGEADVYDAETRLMKAKQDLADYVSEKKTNYDEKKEALEDAQTAYDRASEAYNAALDALNKKMAELSVE